MTSSSSSVLNGERLDYMRDIMDEDFQDFIEEFLENGEELVAEINNAVTGKDPVSIRGAAHSFKSNCGYVGADTLMEYARNMENMGRDGNIGNAPQLMENIYDEFEKVKQALNKELSST